MLTDRLAAMKITEVREMRTDELGEKLDELERQIFTMRTQAVTEDRANTRAMREIRKDIARVKTVIRENETKGGNE